MGVIKRAWLSMNRQRKKSLILFGIIFILGNVIAGSYAVLSGTRNVEAVIKRQLSPVISIELDSEKWTEAVSENLTQDRIPPMIRAEELISIGHSSYVKSYDFTYSISVISDELESWNRPSPGDSITTQPSVGGFQLVGTEYAPLMILEENKAALVSGRPFTLSEIDQGQAVAIISRELAELNQAEIDQNIIMIH